MMVPVVKDHGDHHHHALEVINEDQKIEEDKKAERVCTENLKRYYEEKNSKK